MPCYKPLHGFRAKTVNSSGKRSIVFKAKEGFQDLPVTVPCGRCVGCRLERSRQWAIRCVHEAQMHDQNCFITLTYNDDHLPYDGSLNKKHYQDFMKRLRHAYEGREIRYYHCGEYGEENWRPHYHSLLFGLDFEDKQLLKEYDGNRIYTSEKLERIWRKGFCTIGPVTFETAAYTARYVMKKRTGEDAEEYYQAVNPYTGELHQLEPPYTTMSRNPGIGSTWLKKYKGDVYPFDEIVINGKKMRPPRYYDEQLPEEEIRTLKHIRVAATKFHPDNTRERLDTRCFVKEKQLKDMKRNRA